MAIDHRAGTKIIKNLRREEGPGVRVDPYPYIGIVKNNLDPTRSGRLQIFIPDLGGDPDDPKGWRTVNYASPFMGYTSQVQSATDKPNPTNSFSTVTHSYGMWMVPPDIGVEVIVIFIAGDPMRGFWVACVNSNLSHYMIPALAGTTNNTVNKGVQIPVVEFNETDKTTIDPAFYNQTKPVHDIQYNILKQQGLDKDPTRGAISSSSQRESPSHVFGISTPGRAVNDPADTPAEAANYTNSLNSGKVDDKYLKVKTRKGGHTFVMDDGAALGEDQLVRLRTAKGHQILMHDTENTFYIAHADGSSWVELTNDGSINMFSKTGYNVRSKGIINFHSDKDINFNAVGSINFNTKTFAVNSTQTTLLQGTLDLSATAKMSVKSGGAFAVDAGGKISLKAGGKLAMTGSTITENSGGTDSLPFAKGLTLNKLPDTDNTGSATWTVQQNKLNTLVTVAPTHEPYPRVEAKQAGFKQATTTGIQPQAAYTGAFDAISSVAGTSVKNPVTDAALRKQPAALGTIGTLNNDQVKAYMAQIGQNESSGNYAAVNSQGYVGKYQFGVGALKDQGYIKSSVTSLDQLDNPNSWTGKNNITSKQDWLSNPTVQESAMQVYTTSNYNAMLQNGSITADMPPDQVGGMLGVAHLLGANGASTWRSSGAGADANGTTGSQYFQQGKYAVSVVAPKIPTIDGG